MSKVATLARGSYPADRAAALSGVPLSTVRWWARHDILVPSVSQTRVMLWSYSDLMQLRIIHWLRQPKQDAEELEIPASTMNAVRRARSKLAELDLELWTEDGGPTVRVDHQGRVWLATEPSLERVADGQRVIEGPDGSPPVLEVLAPFQTSSARGPDLVAPRSQLRIVPGKLGGSPHVERTRLESQAVGALSASGLPKGKIYELYPDVGLACDRPSDRSRAAAREEPRSQASRRLATCRASSRLTRASRCQSSTSCGTTRRRQSS